MWLESRFRLCPTAGRPLVLHGGEEYGAPFLVERLKRERAVAWLELGPAHIGDPIAVGNSLATAVNETVGGNLLQHALPFLVHLRALAIQREKLPPFTLVVSRGDLVPEFASAAADACRSAFGLWFLSGGEVNGLDAERVGVEELKLTRLEARQLAPAGIGDEAVAAMYEASGGAYTSFLSEIHRFAGLPEFLVPLAGRWVRPEGAASEEDPRDVLEALLRLGRWIDAVEIATEHAPDRIDDLLHTAGPEFQEQGLLQRLDILLSTIEPPWDSGEKVLEWGLVAAHHAGTSNGLLPRVRRYLQEREAPELRARFAPFLPYSEGLKEAARAASSLPTPLTLWQYGRMHPETTAGIELLTRSVSQAELEANPYACARSAGSLAARFIHAGDFQAAASWAMWGLQVFDENGLKDGLRRLRLYQEMAYARTMLGDTSGLREQLQGHLSTVDEVLPALAAGYRLALSDLVRLEGETQLAAEYTAVNYSTAPRSLKGLRAYQHVRSLLELGEVGEAARIAESALALSAGVPALQDMRARLALGMVQAFTDPWIATATLAQVMNNPELVFEQKAMAALHYLLAQPEGLAHIPEDLRHRMGALSETALRVLSGPPDAFHTVWRQLGEGSRPPLELKVLGRVSARLEGAELRLTRRQWEILLALALNPEGLGYEALHAFLLHDVGGLSIGTLRSHVSHLREQVPVSDSPYRIEVDFSLDVDEVQALLRDGRIREAIALVHGPLLPSSSLPGIRDAGEQFDQALRESVISSGDPEALYSATVLWSDDLQVWEATLAALHARDPRVPLLRARVQALRSEYGTA